jgi:hypothetical protein
MFQVQALRLIKSQLKILTSVFLAVLIFGMSVLPVFAATPEKSVNASAKLAFNLKGLNHNLAVQKAYIASKYLYVTQRPGGTVYLSRLASRSSQRGLPVALALGNSPLIRCHCASVRSER